MCALVPYSGKFRPGKTTSFCALPCSLAFPGKGITGQTVPSLMEVIFFKLPNAKPEKPTLLQTTFRRVQN